MLGCLLIVGRHCSVYGQSLPSTVRRVEQHAYTGTSLGRLHGPKRGVLASSCQVPSSNAQVRGKETIAILFNRDRRPQFAVQLYVRAAGRTRQAGSQWWRFDRGCALPLSFNLAVCRACIWPTTITAFAPPRVNPYLRLLRQFNRRWRYFQKSRLGGATNGVPSPLSQPKSRILASTDVTLNHRSEPTVASPTPSRRILSGVGTRTSPRVRSVTPSGCDRGRGVEVVPARLAPVQKGRLTGVRFRPKKRASWDTYPRVQKE